VKGEDPAGRVIVLNGGSSSGKTTVGRRLQQSLPETWLLIGIDVLIWLLPVELVNDPNGLLIENGVVQRSAEFMRLNAAFQQAVAAIARSGVNVILDDLMHDGLIDRRRWDEALIDLDTLWVGVHCDVEVAEDREYHRGDRPRGLARSTATTCHLGLDYNIEVDTSVTVVDTAVQDIVREVRALWPIEMTSAPSETPPPPPLSAWTIDGDVSRPPWEH
jgi:chloramphenicol 3-O phosphotransferase